MLGTIELTELYLAGDMVGSHNRIVERQMKESSNIG